MCRVTYIFMLCVGLAGWVTPPRATAQVPSAADFTPVVRGGPPDVKQPEKVALKEDVVTAATAQDAINAAVDKNVENLGGSNIEEIGATIVRFPSGIGFVATDMATYRTMSSPTATRIAKRKAYVIAFVKAKKNLAEILGGLKNEGREAIRDELLNLTLPDEEMTNASTVSEEVLRQTVEMMLRGFVIYEVKDDVDQNAVFVSIVTTPKTRRHVSRPAPNAVVAGDVQEGLDQVLDEIRTGLVPPVGGRIVSVPSTGQTAFVGFGSAVIRTSTNRALQAKNNYAAKRIAGMRSKDALCGLLVGDRTSWEGKVIETLQEEIREFEPVMEEDPMAMDGRKMAQPLETFRSTQVFKDVYQSARKGILPPGVITKTWFDEDHAWSYGMSVFWASVNVLAEGAAGEMARGPLFDRTPPGRQHRSGQPSDPFTDRDNQKIRRPGTEVKRGPTGKIAPDDNL